MAIIGTGISIDFGSGFIAELISVELATNERAVIDVTHMGSATMEFVSGALINAGELNCTIAFDPKLTPPFGAAELITITFPEGSTWAAVGFASAQGFSAELEERVVQTVNLKFTGAWAITPST